MFYYRLTKSSYLKVEVLLYRSWLKLAGFSLDGRRAAGEGFRNFLMASLTVLETSYSL